jgi:hypothetical protein
MDVCGTPKVPDISLVLVHVRDEKEIYETVCVCVFVFLPSCAIGLYSILCTHSGWVRERLKFSELSTFASLRDACRWKKRVVGDVFIANLRKLCNYGKNSCMHTAAAAAARKRKNGIIRKAVIRL